MAEAHMPTHPRQSLEAMAESAEAQLEVPDLPVAQPTEAAAAAEVHNLLAARVELRPSERMAPQVARLLVELALGPMAEPGEAGPVASMGVRRVARTTRVAVVVAEAAATLEAEVDQPRETQVEMAEEGVVAPTTLVGSIRSALKASDAPLPMVETRIMRVVRD